MLRLRNFSRVGLMAFVPIAFTLSNLAHNSPSKKQSSCGNPVCNDQLKAFQMAASSLQEPKKTPSENQNVSAATKDIEVRPVMLPPSSCPLDRRELGEKTWSLLHTIAAYYPEEPTEEQQNAASQFFQALAILYPCRHCAEDFQENITLFPPNVSSNEKLALWVCEQHNSVNEKLGKETFPCNLEKLNERWRTGAQTCWANGSSSLASEVEDEEESSE